MIEQPKRGDGEKAWRTYAGQLRRELGEVRARLDGVRDVEQRAHVAESRLAGANSRAERWKEDFGSLLASKRRDGRILNELERALRQGDIPAALALVNERRRGIREAFNR